MMVQNTKKRVLVTYVEAGFGHITTANSIATAIETLHDPSILDIYKEFEQAIRAKRNGAIPIAKFIQTYEA